MTEEAVGAPRPTEPITVRCYHCGSSIDFDPVRGPARLRWLGRKFGGHYCEVINKLTSCCEWPYYYEDSIREVSE